MAVHRNTTLDPRQFVIIKPLPISKPSGNKLQARSSTVYSACHPTREQVFWDNYHRRQRQLSRQGYRAANWRPYEEVGEPLHLEPKKLILDSLGQLDEASKDRDMSEVEDDPIRTAIPDSAGENKKLPFKCPPTRKREDITTLRKHLCHTRQLVLAVQQGRGYFHLLQREEQEEQEVQQRERRQREQWRCTELQPPRFFSDQDSDSDSESGPVSAWAGLPRWRATGRKRSPSARPFTPVHRSLTSPQLHEVPQEPVYRQLCCLNWLLEALTLDRSGRTGPLTSCWDPKDPGRSRTTIKKLNKERAIQTKWDQFIAMPKPRRATASRPSRSPAGRLPPRRAPSLSAASSQATTPASGSLTSLAPGTDDTTEVTVESEDVEPPSAGDSDAEPPVSEYLQKLLNEVYQNVAREFHGPEGEQACVPDSSTSIKSSPERRGNMTGVEMEPPRPNSSPPRQLSATSQFIHRKSAMLCEMKASFEEREEELAQSLTDTLESNAKRRRNSGVQRFQALCHTTPSLPRRAAPAVTSLAACTDTTDTAERPFSTQWLCGLLGALLDAVCRDSKLRLVLEKLQHFAAERSLRVRPHVLLKVLGSLQPWELCNPDLCVAIEIVREHVVGMTKEEYDTWLLSRVALPQRAQRDPPPPYTNTHTSHDILSQQGVGSNRYCIISPEPRLS